MRESIKILCKEEIYSLGLKEALKNENVSIIKNTKNLSEKDILITDRSFYSRKKVIMLYDDLHKALLGNERIKLLKTTTVEELLMAVKAVKRDKKYIQSNILKAKLKRDEFIQRLETLTPRQKELIKGITKNMTNYEIAKKLYLSEKTIKNNLTDLYKEIGVNNRLELQQKIYKIK